MMGSISTIKSLDRIIGPSLLKLFPETAPARDTQQIKKILVIRPGGMGDALLLLPILKELTASFQATIDVVCEPRNQSIFNSVLFINKVFSYRNPRMVLSLFQKKYDAVFDTEQSHFLSAILTRMIRAKIKAGFKTNGREKMYNRSLAYHQADYEAEAFWTLFSTVFHIEKPFQFNFPYFDTAPDNPPVNFPQGDIVCLFPGASIDERIWPENRWADVIDWLVDHEFKPVLIGGKKELRQCRTILKNCKKKEAYNACGTLSIRDTARLFTLTSLLISTDSGILHLGAVCDVPTISLFGPGIAAKWAPRGPKHTAVNKNISCSPCTLFGTTPECQKNKECMMQITSMDMIAAIKDKYNFL